jgi:hypothetical protein
MLQTCLCVFAIFAPLRENTLVWSVIIFDTLRSRFWKS